MFTYKHLYINKLKAVVLLIFLQFFIIDCFAQTNKSFNSEIDANSKIFKENFSEGYKHVPGLLQKARMLKDSKAELLLLDRTCRYYYLKNDVNGLILASQKLAEKSRTYKDAGYEAMSHTYKAEAYSMNQLFSKAINELDVAMKLMDDAKIDNVRFRYTYSNILLSQANLYCEQKNFKTAVEKVRQALKHYPNNGNVEALSRFQYINYSNMASIYTEFNTDSAYYYAQKSADLKSEGVNDDDIMALNYYVKGKYYHEHNNREKAQAYYLKASEIYNTSGEQVNLTDLYKNIILFYKEKGDSAKVTEFTNKLNILEYNTLKSKYNSLQHVLASNQNSNKEIPGYWLIALAVGVIFLVSVMVLYFGLRKKRQLFQKEENFNEIKTEEVLDDYNTLLEMLKRDDSAFMVVFERLYPDFIKQLLEVNTSLVQSEIEFCALLRMKLSTKQISQLTHIEVRTVQNKKHRIRKKLEIPADKDIYVWLEDLT